ncbi:glycosyltransferase [Nodularia spumigena]|uniref:Glycosyltransferase n=1 Tax=Nodularia spumigena UHCC 0060 TaxID=3110300 RepID=A0ABU5UXR8_NODSP|nr:glycosyltransferase [Nodularia spumigena]MEA5526327.1 glycosyltransferase [Nodularia spumigena UHCC 0143]MEA5611113.1 glycosyltransferase [Nodularia spumigena UHCC 0060]MEA5612895.1 glycosyltransferase [Nodularia spumigena UHCC 0040]
MNNQKTIKVFIGSGEASLLERKVAIYSLQKHTQRQLDIYVFNGTHNAIELNDQEPFLAPLSLKLKYHNITEFSLYRFLIPQICNYQGKAIWIDSDTVCLADIAEIFDTSLNGCDFLAKAEAYNTRSSNLWGLSVMLIDCKQTRFDLETYFNEIAQGLYTYTDFSCMSPAFLAHHPLKIGQLDPQWNVFDYCDEQTKLIHYTNLNTQPWKYPHHPYGELWFEYFEEARKAGYITERDIEFSLVRAYVRPDILQGNAPIHHRQFLRQTLKLAKNALRKLVPMRLA